MNYIKLYIGDYLKKTGSLSVAEHGAYMLMLMSYYATEEPLPKGKELYRLIRAETRQDRQAVDAIAQRFWVDTPAGLTHERADEEIRKAEKAREQHALAGTKGGRPRKQTKTKLVFENEPNEKPTNTNNHISTSLRSVGRARATRLPPNWEPDDLDWGNACVALGTPQAQAELAKFRDYWAAKAGAGGSKLDWSATWRNWVRKADEYAKSRGTGERLSAVERVRRDSEEWARRQAGDCVLAANGEPVRAQMGQPIRLVAGRVVDESPDDVGF